MEKKIGKYWIHFGVKSGFGIGFNISKYSIDFDLAFWYFEIEL